MGRTRSRQGRSGLCPPPGLRQGSWRLNKWPTELTVAPKSCCCFFSFQTAICRGWQRVPSWTCESLASKVGPCGPSLWFLVLPQRDLPLLPGCWSPCQGPALLPLCAVAMATAGSASVLGEPTFASPSQTPGAAWEGGWGWDGCPGRAGPSIPVRRSL